jgi:hypothetical protein
LGSSDIEGINLVNRVEVVMSAWEKILVVVVVITVFEEMFSRVLKRSVGEVENLETCKYVYGVDSVCSFNGCNLFPYFRRIGLIVDARYISFSKIMLYCFTRNFA